MSGSEEDADDKPYEASQKRLEDARKKGEVPQSRELVSAGTFAGVLLAAAALGRDSLTDLGGVLAAMLARAEPLSAAMTAGPFAPAAAAPMLAVLGPVSPWFALPFGLALLAVVAQRALVFAPEKLRPKLERISPLTGARNKFGRDGLFEFAKSAVKLCLISAVLAVYILWRLPLMMVSMSLDPGQVAALLLKLAFEFLSVVLVLTLALGTVDALWQWAQHARKHRMSRKELMDETKESEGDPWLKSRRREKGTEIAMNRMMADVPRADVVIVNPTHFAVALRWDRTRNNAPVCVAKGVDEVARRIRETAMEAGVPVRSDPPTARALYDLVPIGAEVPPDHYRAVAVAIRFAEAVRARAGARRGS